MLATESNALHVRTSAVPALFHSAKRIILRDLVKPPAFGPIQQVQGGRVLPHARALQVRATANLFTKDLCAAQTQNNQPSSSLQEACQTRWNCAKSSDSLLSHTHLGCRKCVLACPLQCALPTRARTDCFARVVRIFGGAQEDVAHRFDNIKRRQGCHQPELACSRLSSVVTTMVCRMTSVRERGGQRGPRRQHTSCAILIELQRSVCKCDTPSSVRQAFKSTSARPKSGMVRLRTSTSRRWCLNKRKTSFVQQWLADKELSFAIALQNPSGAGRTVRVVAPLDV